MYMSLLACFDESLLLTPLFVAKDQIDPLVQMRRHVLALQCPSVLGNELGRRAVRPWWQLHIANPLSGTVLPPT